MYQAREKIEATLHLHLEQGNLPEGNFSVSVTDSAEVADILGAHTIFDEAQFEKLDSGFVRLGSPIEKDISYYGVVKPALGKPKPASVFIFDRKASSPQLVNTHDRGHFDFSVHHEDTLLYYLGSPAEQTTSTIKTISVFRRTPNPLMNFSDADLDIPLKNENMKEQISHAHIDSSNAIVLKE